MRCDPMICAVVKISGGGYRVLIPMKTSLRTCSINDTDFHAPLARCNPCPPSIRPSPVQSLPPLETQGTRAFLTKSDSGSRSSSGGRKTQTNGKGAAKTNNGSSGGDGGDALQPFQDAGLLSSYPSASEAQWSQPMQTTNSGDSGEGGGVDSGDSGDSGGGGGADRGGGDGDGDGAWVDGDDTLIAGVEGIGRSGLGDVESHVYPGRSNDAFIQTRESGAMNAMNELRHSIDRENISNAISGFDADNGMTKVRVRITVRV